MHPPKGIRVNAGAQGPVATNIEATFSSTLGQERIGVAMQLLPAMAEAAQLAASATFLLSADGANISGAIRPSDGGWSATSHSLWAHGIQQCSRRTVSVGCVPQAPHYLCLKGAPRAETQC
jgi:enoyl-[acyl-carrier-protein] reductase (NADH)